MLEETLRRVFRSEKSLACGMAVLMAAAFAPAGLRAAAPAKPGATLTREVASAVGRYAPQAEVRLRPYFSAAGVEYPPRQVALLVFKEERVFEVWARKSVNQPWTFVRAYPILAASGQLGPKLRQGDMQVPEGFYRVLWLNPASAFHLSLKLSYPNAFDLEMARKDGRTQLGGDIFVHGNEVSIGCIALGDPAIEEIFVLVAKTGTANVDVLVLPRDFRRSKSQWPAVRPQWSQILYSQLAEAVSKFQR